MRVASCLALLVALGCSCDETRVAPTPAAPTAAPTSVAPPRAPVVEATTPNEPVTAASLCTTFLAGRSEALADFGLEGGCISAGRGAWELVVELDAPCEEIEGWPRYDQGRLRLQYETVDGVITALPWNAMDDCEVSVHVGATTHDDWDGDGHDELVASVSTAGPEDGSVVDAVWHFDGTSIVPYAPAAAFAASTRASTDVDGDGRVDVVSPLPLAPREMGGASEVEPLFVAYVETLWHSLPDGTFSRSDDVARAHVRAQCPDPSSPYFSSDDRDTVRAASGGGLHASLNAVCARLRGTSVDEIRTAVTAELADLPCEPEEGDTGCWRDEVIDELIEIADEVDVSVRID